MANGDWSRQEEGGGGGRGGEGEPCVGCECVQEEFQPEYVCLIHPNPSLFVTSQWPMKQLHYLIYRWAVASLLVGWVIADFLDESLKFYSYNYAIWLVFATNWGFLINVTTAILQAVLATYYYTTVRCDNELMSLEGMPLPLCVQWCLFNLSTNGSLVVSISYWTFLTAFEETDFLSTPMSKLKHTLNSVYAITDLVISATPVRIFHLVYPLLLGALYTVFNAIYFVNNGMGPGGKPYAYYVMDWRNPIESAFTCSMGFIMATLVQFFIYQVYRFRIFVHEKVTRCVRTGEGNDSEMQSILSSTDELSYSTHNINGTCPTTQHDTS